MIVEDGVILIGILFGNFCNDFYFTLNIDHHENHEILVIDLFHNFWACKTL